MSSIIGIDGFDDFIFAVKALESAIDGELLNKALEHGLEPVLAEQRRIFGRYPRNTGSFPKWRQLSPERKAARERMGGQPNWPLFWSGELRDSYQIGRDEDGRPGIFSEHPAAAVHEFGGVVNHGAIIPQRSTLGLAFERKEAQAFRRTMAYLRRELRARSRLNME